MRWVALGLGIAATGCIIPYAVPPMKAEVGAASPIAPPEEPMQAERSDAALHAAIGVSAASGTTRQDIPFDLGAGVLMETSGNGANATGGYVDAAYFVHREGVTRISVGFRAEVRHTALGLAAVTKARFDAEIFHSGHGPFEGSDRCGATAGSYHGTGGLGLYAEGGPSYSPDGVAFVASAGVSVRIPTAVGVYIGIPWCK